MDENQELGWLIRDNSNRIRGPFKQNEIVQLIKKGQLKGKTEISRANSYWFAIEEKAELGRFLPEFNGGKPPPEQPTQMTATLTEADIQDRGVEITQFVAVPTKKDLEEPAKKGGPSAEGITSGTQQIEWLSDEFAQEFGDDFGVSVSSDPANEVTQAGEPQPLKEPVLPTLPADQKTPVATQEDKNREMLKRATVKADTLPSEHKSFQGDRPKPIDTLMRVRQPGATVGAGHHSNLVNVPVEPEPAPKMFIEEPEGNIKARQKRRLLIVGAILGLAVLAAIVFFVVLPRNTSPGKVDPVRTPRRGDDASASVKQSIILSDLEGAKSAISDLEQESGTKNDSSLFLAQAIVRKEFLFDGEGAISALQAAKSSAKNKRMEAEVDNLLAVYSFEKDKNAAAEMLRRNLENFKDDSVFRYNLALSLLRAGRPQEALPLLDSLLAGLLNDNGLVEDTALALGWALESFCGHSSRDPQCKRDSDAEAAFQRALQANPHSAKARLGLALYRLRRGGIKSSEADFRTFLDAAPELDPPMRISNFRKLTNSEFYDFAHTQIVDLNTPGQNVSKPSPLIMASDALILSMQLKTSEAGKILDGALSAAPGDVNVLKALGYLRWKDGRHNEVVDGLRDIKERGSYALNLMLGKAYFKLRKKDQAEKYYRVLIESFPSRSEGHSLLGELLLEQPDKAEEAKAEFQQALKKDPLDLVAWRGLQRAGAPIVLSPEIQKNLPF